MTKKKSQDFKNKQKWNIEKRTPKEKETPTKGKKVIEVHNNMNEKPRKNTPEEILEAPYKTCKGSRPW